MAVNRLLYKFNHSAARDKKVDFIRRRITTFAIIERTGRALKKTGMFFSIRPPSVFSILFIYSVLAAKKENYPDVANISLSVILRNPFALLSEIQIKLTNIFCE
jgi:hypothetical protein